MTDEELIRQLRKVGTTNGYDNSIVAIAADRLEAITAALPHMGGVAPTHRHKKRGTEYVLIGIGKMQAEHWEDHGPDGEGAMVDMREVAVYRSATDPTEIWVRPREEFEDGRFEALASHEPAKDGPEVVERLRKWCSETINQWSDEYEPRENWERQVSGAMREWDKATTEIISDYEALRAENERLRKHLDERLIVERALRRRAEAAEARNAELVKALDGLLKPFEGDDCRYDHHGHCQAHFLQEVDECCIKIARRVREGGKVDG